MSSSMAFALKQRTFITNYLRLPVVDALDHRALEAAYNKVLFAFFQYAVYAFCNMQFQLPGCSALGQDSTFQTDRFSPYSSII